MNKKGGFKMRSQRKSHLLLAWLLLPLLLVFPGCGKAQLSAPANWEQALRDGRDKEVTILMWGGNESINRYMDGFVSENLKDLHGITLRRVPMNAPEYLSKLLNEKKTGLDPGTADLVWINAENFRTAKEGGLLWGPFTDMLPTLKTAYDPSSSDLSMDTGIPIDGYEAIWGRAQLVLTYDSAKVPNPPKTYEALLAWAKENPGQFTYPKLPDDFVGSAFVRNAYYELAENPEALQGDMDKRTFAVFSQPVIQYFNSLAPYLWREGTAYPATQAQQDELFKNGEVAMTMGFEIGKTAGLVQAGIYADTVKAYVFDTGTIGNAHYLAIPYNAPEKAAAMLVVDFLQSPAAQLRKFDPEVWGDMPALDVTKLDNNQKGLLAELESVPGTIPMSMLSARRNPEMKSVYIDYIKELWTAEVGR
jgi:putative spermidine/putrescine transport system substrate-binding protein